jgi:hypothetical protein
MPPTLLGLMTGSLIRKIKKEVALCGYPMVDNCKLRLENVHFRFELDNPNGTTYYFCPGSNDS